MILCAFNHFKSGKYIHFSFLFVWIIIKRIKNLMRGIYFTKKKKSKYRVERWGQVFHTRQWGRCFWRCWSLPNSVLVSAGPTCPSPITVYAPKLPRTAHPISILPPPNHLLSTTILWINWVLFFLNLFT